MINLIAFIYIITIATGGLNLFGNPWLILPLLTSALTLVIVAAYKRFTVGVDDCIFFAFLMIVIISSLNNINVKSLNYVLAWFIGFYLMLYKTPQCISKVIRYNLLIKFVGISGIVFAFISVIEQLMYFMFGYILFFSIPRFDYDHANYMSIFYRSYGFSNEPSNLANFLLLTLPFVFRSFGKLAAYFVILGLIPTFSAGGFVLGCLGFISSILIKLLKTKKRFITNSVTLLVWTPITLYLVSFAPIAEKIFNKIRLNPDNLSANLRFQRILDALNIFNDYPVMGLGPGYWSASIGVSPNNIYLLVLTETGLLGMLAFLLFLMSISIFNKGNYLGVDPTRIYLIIVGLGFGLFSGVSYSLVGIIFLVIYNQKNPEVKTCQNRTAKI